MIRRTPVKATLALGTLFGIGLLFAGVQPAAADPPRHAPAHGYRSRVGQHRFGHNYGRYDRRGWYGGRNTWGWDRRSPFYGSRFGWRRDLDRDGIRNRRDRDKDGDGIRNGRDRHPRNPRRR